MKRKFAPWSMTECDECGAEFQVTRTLAKEIEGRVICDECALYQKAYDEGFKHGYAKAKQDASDE